MTNQEIQKEKAIISQHPDAMTAVDRQGELQLIAKLSSFLSTSPSPPRLLSLHIISLCTQQWNFTDLSATFDYDTNSSVCLCVCEHAALSMCVLCSCFLFVCVCCFFLKSCYTQVPLSTKAPSKQMPQCSPRVVLLFI